MRRGRVLSRQPCLLLLPCSGGGLTAGCALVAASESSATRLWTVEPEGFDDTARSLALGRRVVNTSETGSICDALLISPPGGITFGFNRKAVAGGMAVTNHEVQRAVAFAFHALKLVIEPGGAVGLAAILAGKIDCRDKTVATVFTGANVDPVLFQRLVSNFDRDVDFPAEP